MQALSTTELDLEPLNAGHADEMFEILREPALYRYLDYPPPPSVEHLRTVYARVERRESPDGSEVWLNWVVRLRDRRPIGYVQVTIDASRTGWVGYVFSTTQWGRGHATQAMQAVLAHVASAYAVSSFLATVEVENQRSFRLLERLGFHAASEDETTGRALSSSERLFVK